MAKTVSFTEAKAHLSDLVDKVSVEHERYVLTRNGRPTAVLLHPDELEALEEAVEVLGDTKLLASIRRSRREAAERKLLRLEDHGG